MSVHFLNPLLIILNRTYILLRSQFRHPLLIHDDAPNHCMLDTICCLLFNCSDKKRICDSVFEIIYVLSFYKVMVIC